MAVGKRIKVNFVEGVLSSLVGNNDSGTDTIISSDGLASFPVIDHATTGEYAAITVGSEIMHIVSHAAAGTTATVERNREGTVPLEHPAGSPWEHAPTELDYAEALENLVTNTTAGATPTIDADYPVHDFTLTANATFTFTGGETGWATSFTLVLRQDATGSRTVTWPASVKWNEATAPTLSTAASAVDVLTFLTTDGGTTWLGFVAGTGMA